MSASPVPGVATSVPPVAERPALRSRLNSVDLLRGVVMVVMALDHVRDYFTDVRFDPTDLSQTTPALFFTRWVTHFCAPAFVFLAGTGAYLSLARGRSVASLSHFLWTRGLWLIVLEVTVVRWAWAFNLDYANQLWVQVIWALGVSMIVLAALVRLPLRAVATIGLVMIVGHNLLDPVRPEQLAAAGWLWTVLHEGGQMALPTGTAIWVLYPLVPWIGVMAVGYAFGAILQRPEAERRRALVRIGVALTAGFVVLRAVNLYGDPSRWSAQDSPLYTVLSFLNTTKYPPSLLFLLMTLGPAIASLAWFERLSGPVARFFTVFGRVPLFYYVLHLVLGHVLVLIVAAAAGFDPREFFTVFFAFPSEWGYGLGVVYLVWAAVVLMLYPVCRWFAGVKARRRDPWLSYL